MRGWVFAGWVVVGALGAFTSIAILSIGIFVFPFFVLAGAFVTRRTRYPLDALGLVAGLGLPLLAVAFANRGGGGFDAHRWGVVGGTLVAVGVATYLALRVVSSFVPCRRAAK